MPGGFTSLRSLSVHILKGNLSTNLCCPWQKSQFTLDYRNVLNQVTKKSKGNVSIKHNQIQN